MRCPICDTPLKGNESVCPVCGHALFTPQMQLADGSLLGRGRYTIHETLGQGGFGITYRGTDTTLHREIAVKEFFPEGATRHSGQIYPPTSLAGGGFTEALDRFIDEARTLARFNHPGIVRVLDVFEENATAYLVMEYLRGETLAARIAKAGRLGSDEVMALAETLTDALMVVHSAALLHRDIKPDNVFLTSDGRTVLIDFGSARGYTGNQTVRHTRLVTAGYAPPEQYASQARFGPYTDIYALSATLFHALSGQAPPQATDRMLGATLPPLPSSVPANLVRALETGLAIRIEERPADLEGFTDLLHRPERLPAPAAARPRVEVLPPQSRTSPIPPLPPRNAQRPMPQGNPTTVMVQGGGCPIGCLLFFAVPIVMMQPRVGIPLMILAFIVMMTNQKR